jgi:hypothetical protein
MMNGNTNFYSVSLTINHNWEPTIKRVKNLLLFENQVDSYENGLSDHFDLNSLGSISKHRLSKSWHRVSGPAVNKTMPWLDDFLKSMSELNPDDGSISFLDGNAGGHVDLQQYPSALNYVFYNTDPEAHTWIRNGDNIEIYPSAIGSAWILDTQKEHGIKNSGIRYSLSIHFGANYQTVKQWFDKQTNLTFGSYVV